MTNGEKYKTAEELEEAFQKFCHGRVCGSCPVHASTSGVNCRFAWMYKDAGEEPTACPFCGKRCNTISYSTPVGPRYKVVCSECSYASKQYKAEDLAVFHHNRIAKAAKDSEKTDLDTETELRALRQKVAAFGCGSYDEELKRMSVGAFRRLKQQLKDANDCIEEVSNAISNHSRNPNEKKAAKAIGKYRFEHAE